MLKYERLEAERESLERALKGARIADGRELRCVLADKERAPQVITWLLELGRLQEYRLALELLEQDAITMWEAGVRMEEEVEAGSRGGRKKWPRSNKGRQF